MLADAFPKSLDYHLSKLVAYPFYDGPVKWGGSADAEAVRNGIDEFEKRLRQQEDYTTPYIGDIESVRAAIDKLVAYYDSQGESMDAHTAYALGYFVRGVVREYFDSASELDRAG